MFIKYNEVELAVREWLPVAGTGVCGEGKGRDCETVCQVWSSPSVCLVVYIET